MFRLVVLVYTTKLYSLIKPDKYRFMCTRLDVYIKQLTKGLELIGDWLGKLKTSFNFPAHRLTDYNDHRVSAVNLCTKIQDSKPNAAIHQIHKDGSNLLFFYIYLN